MILNIIFFSVTVVVLYIGYSNKAMLFFLVGMLVDDTMNVVRKIRKHKAVYSETNKSYSIEFLVDDLSYKLVIPENSIHLDQNKISAISDSKIVVTKEIRKVFGPEGNFFGFKIKPVNIGLKNVSIWNNKRKYHFEENDDIVFEDKYLKISYDN